MSTTPAPRKSRPRAAKFTLASAVTLGLVGGPVALAAPADASTSLRGCTVDPLKPTQHNHRIDYRIKVDCNGNKTVEIKQLRFEDERGRRHDDFLGSFTFWESFGHHDGSVTIHTDAGVPWFDHGHDGKVYQVVSFRVRSGDSDNWSDWSNWEKSEVGTVWH